MNDERIPNGIGVVLVFNQWSNQYLLSKEKYQSPKILLGQVESSYTDYLYSDDQYSGTIVYKVLGSDGKLYIATKKIHHFDCLVFTVEDYIDFEKNNIENNNNEIKKMQEKIARLEQINNKREVAIDQIEKVASSEKNRVLKKN